MTSAHDTESELSGADMCRVYAAAGGSMSFSADQLLRLAKVFDDSEEYLRASMDLQKSAAQSLNAAIFFYAYTVAVCTLICSFFVWLS